MSKILELRTKRNTLWEQTKDFLEKNRGENGLVKAEAVEQYNKMAQEVKDLGSEIERLEQQAQIEAQLSAPTSSPVHADPKNGAKKDVKPTATAEYAENFWNMIRNRGHYGEVRNALSVGEDTEGGFTVPDEFEKKLVEALEENNIFRGMATVIRTSSGTRKIPIAEDTGEASWIDEGEEIPESDATFGQTMLSAYKLGTMIKISNELLNDSAFDLATYIARRFGVRMGNAEERAFITGDGVGKPLGLLAEGFTLSKLADACVYVVRANVLRKESLRLLSELEKDKRLSDLGVVLNGVKVESGGYGYGYVYGYQYSYGNGNTDRKTS